MFRYDDHLADDELLLAIDHELPSPRQAAIAAHLARCATCRTRSADIERSANAFTEMCARDLASAADGGEPARARLHATMREASEQWDRSWQVRLSSALAPGRRWGLAGAGLAAATVLVVALFLWTRVDRPDAGASVERDALPVASLTPGVTAALSARELCGLRVHERRTIPDALRRQVLRAYQMEHVPSNEYELDYLITPELGGATDARNLWPQRYAFRGWNARVKDQLERLLPAMVCSGQLDLKTAQREIAVDWIAAYRKYFKTRDPLEPQATSLNDDDDRESPAPAGPARVTTASPGAPRVRLISF